MRKVLDESKATEPQRLTFAMDISGVGRSGRLSRLPEKDHSVPAARETTTPPRGRPRLGIPDQVAAEVR